MVIRITDIRRKEVINIHDGKRLGFVLDIDIDEATGKIMHVIVPGRPRFMFFLGRDNDIIIPWENVKTMGEDIILIQL